MKRQNSNPLSPIIVLSSEKESLLLKLGIRHKNGREREGQDNSHDLVLSGASE